MAVPKLRFKEFDGDWSPYVLKDFVSFRKGKGISKADISENGINECIRYGELYTTYGQVIDHIHSKTNVSKSECILSKAGDVIIPASGETQIDIATASCVLHDDIILSGDLNILSHKENGSWLAYYLSSAKKLEIAQLAQGNSVVHLYSSQLKDLKINKPSKEEQTKIASFLSNVDEKISQLTQKHALLSQYKQGMMQKLFSQQIRFKADDGSEFGEWENLKIFDLAIDKTLNNGVFNDQNKVGKGYKLINVLDMYINRDIDESRLKLLDLSTKDFEKNKVYYGDIFFTRSSLVKEGIAFSNVYLGNSNDVTYDGHLIKLSPNLNRVNPIFLNYILKTHVVRKQLIKGGKTATMTTIGQQEVGNTIVSLPCLEEQTKIANFLSSIDQKIEVVAQQIEQAKQWKKGLLQQMFV